MKKWGGSVEDYQSIHEWFDESKAFHGDFRHRVLRHHTQGIFECEKVFGNTITISSGRIIPVRWVAEQHVIEDCGRLISLSDWCNEIEPAEWMNKSRKLSKELGE